MAQRIIEPVEVLRGTWEEIEEHRDRLAGRLVRIEVFEKPDSGQESAAPFYATATPEEWAQAFRDWSNQHRPRNAPPLSDEAISRETIYGERD